MFSEKLFEAIAKGQSSYTVPKPTKKGMPSKKRGRKPGSKNKPKEVKVDDESVIDSKPVKYEKKPPREEPVSFMGLNSKVKSIYSETSYKTSKFFKGVDWAKKTLLAFPKKEVDNEVDNAIKNAIRYKNTKLKMKRSLSAYSVTAYINHPVRVLSRKIDRIAYKKANAKDDRFLKADPFWFGVVSVGRALLHALVETDKEREYRFDMGKDILKKYLDLEVDKNGGVILPTEEEHMKDVKSKLKKLASKKNVPEKDVKKLVMDFDSYDEVLEALRYYSDQIGYSNTKTIFDRRLAQHIRMKKILGKDWKGK